jgi:hypothetical protein
MSRIETKIFSLLLQVTIDYFPRIEIVSLHYSVILRRTVYMLHTLFPSTKTFICLVYINTYPNPFTHRTLFKDRVTATIAYVSLK